MQIPEIKKQFSEDIFEALLDRDGSGQGYVCPFCCSGAGPKGTGLRPLYVEGTPRHGNYKCFNSGCEWAGDGLDLIAGMFNIPKGDVIAQVKKAEEILHRPLLDSSERNARGLNWDDDEPAEPKKQPEKTNKEEPKNEVVIDENLVRQIQGEMKQYAANLSGSKAARDYLSARGISMDTAIKYKLGFCELCTLGGTYPMNTPALIYPDGPTSYTARSITVDDGRKVRKHKAGKYQDIFNISLLKADSCPPVVFIVEGQADALSIIEAGGQAIATGGTTSAHRIVEEIGKLPPEKLPLFILLPDNDRNEDGTPDRTIGYKHMAKLKAEMEAAAPPIRAAFVDTSDPETWPPEIKDANEFLVRYWADFTNFIHHQESKAKIMLKHEEGRRLGRASEFLQEFLDKMAGATPPISTGYPAVDTLLEGGLHPGLVVMGAISSLGKTTFCLNVAENIAATGQDVVFFSLEMSRYELISKIISRKTAERCLKDGLVLQYAKSNLGISDFTRYEGYNEQERNIIRGCFEDFGNNAAEHLYIREGLGNIGTEAVKKDIVEHINRTGTPPVVIIDYAQILAPADVRSTDKQNTDRNIVELKRMSRDFNTPVIVISSFNRENYTAPVNMTAFKESGALEYTSDVLIGLQHFGMDFMPGESDKARQERIRDLLKANSQAAAEGKAIKIHLKVLKNRSGRKGDTGLNYYPMFNLYL